MSNERIYLDYNASTPIAPEVVETMRPFLTEHYGNPSSQHWAGAAAKEALETSREQVASLLCCSPSEIIFTGGGTEANNHAIKGVFFAMRQKGNHIITSGSAAAVPISRNTRSGGHSTAGRRYWTRESRGCSESH